MHRVVHNMQTAQRSDPKLFSSCRTFMQPTVKCDPTLKGPDPERITQPTGAASTGTRVSGGPLCLETRPLVLVVLVKLEPNHLDSAAIVPSGGQREAGGTAAAAACSGTDHVTRTPEDRKLTLGPKQVFKWTLSLSVQSA